MSRTNLKPAIVSVFQEKYTLPVFVKDLQAGVVVGIVALPLAIAFAIASGVKPEQGLYTAIVAGFLISMFSGSRVQIGGPTGAFVIIVYGVVQKHGMEGLAIATVMAGIILLLFGFVKLGTAIKFIPFPVTVGFTSGIALLIFSGQIRDFFGLQMPLLPADFIGKIGEYAKYITTVNPVAAAIGLSSFCILVFWPKITQKVPASLIVLVVMTVVVKIFNLPVETIGSRFGAVPSHLPHFALPFSKIDFKTIEALFPSAMTIALLGGIESLLSAVVADGMTGRRHRSNMELVAQGIANIVTPFFGGIPATGAIARTATNIRNGGVTPVSGIIHALTLALCLVVLGGLVTMIPMAALAAILIVVAYNMSEWQMFGRLFKGPRSDVLALVATFLLTVLMDLTIAIGVGIVLAAILFMARMAENSNVVETGRPLDDEADRSGEDDEAAVNRMAIGLPHVVRYKITGAFFFGMADKFKDILGQIADPPKVLILNMQEVTGIDATALIALRGIYEKSKTDKTVLVLQGVHGQSLNVMRTSGYMKLFGPENFVENEALAEKRALEIRMPFMDLTIKDLSILIRKLESEISSLVRNKEIPFQEINGRVVFKKQQIVEWALDHALPLNISGHAKMVEYDVKTISSMLDAQSFFYDCAFSKSDYIEYIAGTLPLNHSEDREIIVSLLRSREELMTTAIGNGISFPHPRIPLIIGTGKPVVQFYFPLQPLHLPSLDNVPVHTLVLIISQTVKQHLSILAHLSFLLSNPGLRDALAARSTPQVLLEMFSRIEMEPRSGRVGGV